MNTHPLTRTRTHTHTHTHTPQAQHFALPQRWDLHLCLISITECKQLDREGNKLIGCVRFQYVNEIILERSLDMKMSALDHYEASY